MRATIDIENLTEENKNERFAQIEKALRDAAVSPQTFKNIKPSANPAARLVFYSFNQASVEKALRNLSFSLGVPSKSAKGEAFVFDSQEDLTDKHSESLSSFVQKVYNYVISYFGLPKVDIVSKAVLTHKGKVLYSPETGEPIQQKDWNKFVSDLEKFLNRNATDEAKRIVLESSALGRILDRMLENNSLENVKKTKLDKLKYKNKTFDWISDSVKNMKTVFGDSLTRDAMGRIEMLIS